MEISWNSATPKSSESLGFFDYIIYPWIGVPSGNLTVRYWKWPSRHSEFSHKKMVIFHSFFGMFTRGYPIYGTSPYGLVQSNWRKAHQNPENLTTCSAGMPRIHQGGSDGSSWGPGSATPKKSETTTSGGEMWWTCGLFWFDARWLSIPKLGTSTLS